VDYFMKSNHVLEDQLNLGSCGYAQQLLRAICGFSNLAIRIFHHLDPAWGCHPV
jgi:hypothetical protein